MKMNFPDLLLILAASLAVACSKVSSEDVSPNAMYFTMALQKDNGSTVECYTRVSVSDQFGNSVELDDDDALTCNGYAMKREKALIGDYIFYTAQLPSVEGGNYQITYVRDGGVYGSGYNQLPPRLNLQLPNNGFTISRSQPMNVTWVPFSGGSISATLATSYTDAQNVQKSVSASGVASPMSGIMTLQALSLKGPLPAQNLAATLTVSRSRQGNLDGNMNGHYDAVDSVTRNGTITP